MIFPPLKCCSCLSIKPQMLSVQCSTFIPNELQLYGANLAIQLVAEPIKMICDRMMTFAIPVVAAKQPNGKLTTHLPEVDARLFHVAFYTYFPTQYNKKEKEINKDKNTLWHNRFVNRFLCTETAKDWRKTNRLLNRNFKLWQINQMA